MIWSQTTWRWLETKLVEWVAFAPGYSRTLLTRLCRLNLVGEEKGGDYNIVFVLDRTPMFSVYSERGGQPFKHEVSPRPCGSANHH